MRRNVQRRMLHPGIAHVVVGAAEQREERAIKARDAVQHTELRLLGAFFGRIDLHVIDARPGAVAVGMDVMKCRAVLDLEPDANQFQLQAMLASRPDAGIGLLRGGLQGGREEFQQLREFRQIHSGQQVVGTGVESCPCVLFRVGGPQRLEDPRQQRVDVAGARKLVPCHRHRPMPLQRLGNRFFTHAVAGNSSFQPVRSARRCRSSSVSRSVTKRWLLLAWTWTSSG